MVAFETPEVVTAPGGKLTESAKQFGIEPKKLMRDYHAFGEQDGRQTIAVGDMANNLVDKKTYVCPWLAEQGGLPVTYEMNGGLVGSIALRQALPTFTETGVGLIQRANEVLQKLNRDLGLAAPADIDPARRFTGYLTHVSIGPRKTTITSVGDVYAWVNGRLVVGEEKPIDTHKCELIDDLLVMLTVGESPECLRDRVLDFAALTHLDSTTADQLVRSILYAIDHADKPDRQTIYTPIDYIVTPWQIRELQNREHPLGYGAIDGTYTPSPSVHKVAIQTANINTLVVATDGSQPASPSTLVYGAADLVPVNPEFGQMVITLRRQAWLGSHTKNRP